MRSSAAVHHGTTTTSADPSSTATMIDKNYEVALTCLDLRCAVVELTMPGPLFACWHARSAKLAMLDTWVVSLLWCSVESWRTPMKSRGLQTIPDTGKFVTVESKWRLCIQAAQSYDGKVSDKGMYYKHCCRIHGFLMTAQQHQIKPVILDWVLLAETIFNQSMMHEAMLLSKCPLLPHICKHVYNSAHAQRSKIMVR